MQTRKHVNTYNTLQKQYELMEKEESLLQSIVDSLKDVRKSPQVAQDFHASFDKVLQGLEANLLQNEALHVEALEQKKCREGEYKDLLEQQELYFHILAQLQEECKVNQDISSR